MSSDGDESQTSEEELFRQAIENLDDEEIEQAPVDGPEEGDERLAEELEGVEVDDESARGTGGGSGEVSDREMFERAMEGMSDEDIEQQKFEGHDREPETGRGSRDTGGGSSAGQNPSSDRQQFEAAMPDVDPIEKSQKFRAPSAPDPDEYLDEDSDRTAEDFITPTLPKSGDGLNDIPSLDDEQKEMLERMKAAEKRVGIPELNLRGDIAREAENRLGDFFTQCRQQGHDFARIIPGRGQQSDPEPVLKPTVLQWLETIGADKIRGYAPERLFGGDYGSLIVEFLDQ
jgi:DNA-nicking Smr family endonuclease